MIREAGPRSSRRLSRRCHARIVRVLDADHSSRFMRPAAAGGGADDRRGGVRSGAAWVPPAPAGGGAAERRGAAAGSSAGAGKGEGTRWGSTEGFALARPSR